MGLIRYPGSKAKLAKSIIGGFPVSLTISLMASDQTGYCEPFFGGGAIGLKLLPNLHHNCRVLLADADPGIVSLWECVRNDPVGLCRAVSKFRPSVEEFYRLTELDGTDTGLVDTALRKLALHRISVSGFGFKAGGPIGGRDQDGPYKVGCRWNPETMKAQIVADSKAMKRLRNLEIRCGDAVEILAGLDSSWFAYVDPPYYVKGDQLYKHSMTPADHARLAEVLRTARCDWALSYDDAPDIRRLYAWAGFKKLEVTYSNAVCRVAQRRKNHEVLIVPERVAA